MKIQVVSLALGLMIVGCQSESTSSNVNPAAVPADARWVEVKDPEITPDTRYAAGQLAESSGKTEAAMEQYKLALKADPKHEPSLYRLGVLYAQQKDYEESIETWKRYVKAMPTNANGYANLGFAHELEGETNDAEAAYKKGIALQAKNEACRNNLGLMLARLGRTSEALTQFQAIHAPAAALYNVASVLEQQGKTAQAKLYYTRALEADPTFFDAQQRLAALGD